METLFISANGNILQKQEQQHDKTGRKTLPDQENNSLSDKTVNSYLNAVRMVFRGHLLDV